ncbi:PrsW family intramembrane metalloprotease [Microlunatus aurantiacus]|uniref:PrsW family intramembrane metalloprotease n=1 Tax=Microlunatus aurantiacus TaxID=446786 RepID=UPI0031DA4444
MSGTVVPWAADPNVAAVLQPRRRRSRLTVVAMVGLGLALLLVAVLLLLAGDPVPLLISTLIAAASFPLLIWFFFWLDRWEPEPSRYRWAALIWGGSAAVLIAAAAQFVIAAFTRSDFWLAVVIAPLTEELAKGLFLVLIVWLRRGQLHGVVDGVVYAGLAGIGFAFTEDVLYYSSALTDGGPTELAALAIVRGLFSPFAHPLFTAAIGVGLGVAVTARSREARILAPLLGYLVAVLLHATWNGSTMVAEGRGFLIAYLVVMLPALAVLVVLATRARQQEGVVVQRALTDAVARGWVSPGDVALAGSLAARREARRAARRRGGRPAEQLMETYSNDLTALAFLHDGVLRSPGPPEEKVARQVGDLIVRTQILRPYAFPVEPSGPLPTLGPLGSGR